MMTKRLETGIRSKKDGYAIGSLFAGIGGIELGLEWSGVGRTVYQIERDEYCREQLARNWPDVPRWGAIEEVDPGSLPHADIICGGFPCQDISIANAKGNVSGARAGLRGARSGLWGHMARIVAAQRPEWVVVENMARGWKKWLPGVEHDLRRLGYETLPVPMEARWFGAPHVRSRLFLLAHADGLPLREHEQRMPGGRAEGLRDGREEVAMEHGERPGWEAQPRLSVVDDGIPHGLGGSVWGAIGNAAVPQCAEVVGWMIREIQGRLP